ncbi:MAG: ABC transporter permease [Bacteroidaceae bacterium]|nr:ABC transporter permease [Bacteroidaceae bacterium]
MRYYVAIAIAFTIVFFTSMMNDGMPQQVPIAVVDLDQTPTTRALVRRLDGFQATNVVAEFLNVAEAREAMQRGEISGYIIFPSNFTEHLQAGRSPHISYYYNAAVLAAGAMAMKDLKTIATLAKAGVGQAVLRAKGMGERETMAVLQPVKVEPHMTGNPWINYNIYITTMVVPGIIFMLVCGTLCYFMPRFATALNSALIAAAGLLVFQLYIYGVLQLPHQGGWWTILLLSLLLITSALGYALFIFALIPSRRLSMSVCSLWGVMSFSLSGAAFPIDSMHPLLQGLSYLFPLRHYFMAYQLNVLHGYPLSTSVTWLSGLVVFSALPLLVWALLRRSIRNFVYTE